MPWRNSLSPSAMLRATASRRPKPISAVELVTMAGMLVTGMPSSVADARSMRSCVMFIDDTAKSRGLAVSTSRSTVSCSSDNRMSQRFTPSMSLSFGSTRLESGLTSTSATTRSRANALSAIGWVTKTRGLLTTLYSRRLAFVVRPTKSDLRSLGHRLDGGVDLRHHLLGEQGHRALGQHRVAPILAGIEQRAEVADVLAEFEDLVRDLLGRTIDDQVPADAVEADFAVRLVSPRLEQFEATALQLSVELAVV